MVAEDACHHLDFLCENYIINGVDNTFYNAYNIPIKTVQALWELVDKKYKNEDVGKKKCMVVRFLDYKMVDS